MNLPATAGADVAPYLAAVFEPEDWVEVRTGSDRMHSSWHRAREVEPIVARCLTLNRAEENIYFGVNPRRGRGQRGNDGVATIRNLWADFDEEHIEATEPGAQVEEVRRRIRDAGLPDPTVILFSGHGVHTYWRLALPVADPDAWDVLLDGIITVLRSCAGVKGRDRILRTPSFINWKPPAAYAELVECFPERRYEWEDIAEPVYLRMPEPAPPPEGVEKLVAAHAGRTWPADRVSVIDAFNTTLSIADVLSSNGYDIVGGKHFRRPGKTDRGFSGIIRTDSRGRLVSAHWSTNDRLNDQKFGKRGAPCGIHDPFSAFTVLEHNGDASAAVKSAAAMLGIALPKAKSDFAILEDVNAGELACGFCDAFFTYPQTPETRRTLRAVLAHYTNWPAQISRILEMAGDVEPEVVESMGRLVAGGSEVAV